MFKRIKSVFITLGIASGMTAAALAYQHTPNQCRAMVLKDMAANAQFASQLAQYTTQQDFLTTMSRGVK